MDPLFLYKPYRYWNNRKANDILCTPEYAAHGLLCVCVAWQTTGVAVTLCGDRQYDIFLLFQPVLKYCLLWHPHLHHSHPPPHYLLFLPFLSSISCFCSFTSTFVFVLFCFFISIITLKTCIINPSSKI